MNSFAALFGVSHHGASGKDLALYARQARQRPGTWVTVQHQHRWLVMGRALQAWKATSPPRSVVRDNTALWEMLQCLCGPVEHIFQQLFAGEMHICFSIGIHLLKVAAFQ